MSRSHHRDASPRQQLHRNPHRSYLITLVALFTVIWIVLALKPIDREAWLLENLLVFVGLSVTWFLHQKMPFSRLSLTAIFIFLCFHSIGAHYTYSLVPYDDWSRRLFSFSINETFGWERNHYDRIVHFLYGFFLAYPIRELFFRVADAQGFWSYFFPLDLTMSTSMIFELFEWWTVVAIAGDLGQTYVGSQGDPWDAHKDMLLASCGAFLTMSLTLLVNWRTQSDFSREWTQSLRLKHWRPLGEDELLRRLHRNHARNESKDL